LTEELKFIERPACAFMSMSTIIDGDVLKKIDGIEGVWVPEIQIGLSW
jgi:hypothetical protein